MESNKVQTNINLKDLQTINPEPNNNILPTDVYDLYKLLVTVESDINEITSDLILANLTEDISKNKIIRFIREQIKVSRALGNIFNQKECRKELLQMQSIILGDVHSLINCLRSPKGEVRNAIITMGKNPEQITEQIPKNTGVIGKLGKLLGKKE